MNKHLIFFLLMLAAFSANAKKVKFAVDMTGLPVNFTGMHVAGDFQEAAGYEGGNWQSNTTLMTNEAGTAIFSVVVDIPAFAKYEYKFINGDQWYEVEFVPLESRVGWDFNDNRWVYVDSVYNDTTMIPAVMFSGNAPAGYHLLRLKVDLSLEEMIDPAGVYLVTNEEIGMPPQSIMYSFADDIYEQIIYTEMWTDYSDCFYLFVNGNTVEGYETVPGSCSDGGSRYIEILKDTVAETVCFSECVSCDALGTAENPQSAKPLLYPNPGKGNTVLVFNDPEKSHDVSIIDILGNTVTVFRDITTLSLLIPCDHLSPGIYFVKIDTGNRWLNTLRLVIADF
jgi:hypothetical protein